MPATSGSLKHVVVALDKNATLLLELSIQPHLSAPSGGGGGGSKSSASASPAHAASPWLLVHGIPVTSGLSHTLMRLLSAEVEASTSLAGSCNNASVAEAQGEATAADTRDEDSLAALSSSALTGTPLPSATANPIIELVRVCFVVSEIHAYALIVKCADAAQAALLKSVLGKATAPGVVIPVESVHECGRVRRVSATTTMTTTAAAATTTNAAEEEGGRPTAVPVLPCAQHEEQAESREATSGPHNTTSTSREEEVGVMCGLWDAVTLNLATSAILPSARRRRRGAGGKAVATQAADEPLLLPSAAAAAVNSSERAAERSSPLMSSAQAPGGVGGAAASPLLLVPPSPALSCSTNAVKDEWCAICQVEPLAAQACVVTLCQHVFHLHCYAKLPSTSADCPLCRFSLYDLLSDVRCEVCHTSEDLWVCLICGFVGCGTGRRSHQQAHSEHTGHSCAMQASTHRIWNTRSRMFLHQEVAMMLDRLHDEDDDTGSNKTDAVSRQHAEAVSKWWARPAEADEDEAQEEMLQAALNESMEDMVQSYYTGVLRSLLEEQERWYESHVSETTAAATLTSASSGAEHEGTRRQKSDAHAVEEAEQQIVQAERSARRRLVLAHVKSVREMFAVSDMELRTMLRRQRGLQEELLEQVLLESHHNSALQKNIGKLRQKIVEAQARGALAEQKATEKERELHARVEAALSEIP